MHTDGDVIQVVESIDKRPYQHSIHARGPELFQAVRIICIHVSEPAVDERFFFCPTYASYDLSPDTEERDQSPPPVFDIFSVYAGQLTDGYSDKQAIQHEDLEGKDLQARLHFHLGPATDHFLRNRAARWRGCRIPDVSGDFLPPTARYGPLSISTQHSEDLQSYKKGEHGFLSFDVPYQ